MNTRLMVSAVALCLCASVGAWAAEKRSLSASYLASFNGPGTIDLTVTGGWGLFGWGLNAEAEYTISQFDLGAVPLSWGITAQASLGFDNDGIGIATGGLATLNFGFDLGKNLRFEGAVGLGPGLVLEAWGGGSSGFGIGQHAAGTWWFSHLLGLTLEEGVVHAFGLVDWYYVGIGVTLTM